MQNTIGCYNNTSTKDSTISQTVHQDIEVHSFCSSSNFVSIHQVLEKLSTSTIPLKSSRSIFHIVTQMFIFCLYKLGQTL